MSKRSYQELAVWAKAMTLVKAVYALTQEFPKQEIYGLTNQMRRAAVSIPSNIAEGKSRYHTKDFIRFLYIARGSCAELETQLMISHSLAFTPVKKCDALLNDITEIGRMLSGLIGKLETSN